MWWGRLSASTTSFKASWFCHCMLRKCRTISSSLLLHTRLSALISFVIFIHPSSIIITDHLCAYYLHSIWIHTQAHVSDIRSWKMKSGMSDRCIRDWIERARGHARNGADSRKVSVSRKEARSRKRERKERK